jgi:hypothetical protein
VQDRFQPGDFLRSKPHMIEETADDASSDNENDDVDEYRNSEDQHVARYVNKWYPKKTKQHELMTSRNIAWPDNRERVRSASRNASLAPRFSLHTRAPDGRMQPIDFDGQIVWAADALAMLIPNDREAARAVPNEVFVHDRFRPGVFMRSTQRMIEETADEPSDKESEDEASDNESDDVDEGRNSQGQDIPRYVKKRYPKRTKQHELCAWTARAAARTATCIWSLAP